MDVCGSVLYVITSDADTAFKLYSLFRSVQIPVEIYHSKSDFLEQNFEDFSGCLLVDINLPEENCQEILFELKELNFSLPIIVTTYDNNIQVAINAMKLGAIDFILKPFNDQLLIENIQKCMNEIRVRPNTLQKKISQLSKREREIMEQIMEGKLNKEIAAELAISISTVELHRRNIMKKFNAKNLAQLMYLYYQAQLKR